MNRREFIKSGAAVAAGVVPARARPGSDRPNIVLILADDLGIEGLGCYGGRSYSTPRLDALAARGVRFQHCYSTPLCTPSRVQLMTGRYGFRTGWNTFISRVPEEKQFVDPSENVTFANLLRDAGYATGVAGKWQLCQFEEHPNHAGDLGFDEYCLWAWKYEREPGEKLTRRYWQPTILQDGSLRGDTSERFGPDVYHAYLLDFMRRHREGPFLAYYSLNLPHWPWVRTPDSEWSWYSDWMATDADHFAEMIEYMDELIGKLLDEIDALGLANDTLVLFTSDNGTPSDFQSLVGDQLVPGGKGELSDNGCHVPLLARWAGRTQSGRVTDDLVDLSDFLPTLAQAAGVSLPERTLIDGRSFLPALLGVDGPRRRWAYSEFEDQHWIRDQRWKLYGDGRLFDTSRTFVDGDEIARGAGPEADSARERLARELASLRGSARAGG